jgi:Virus neck protein
MATNFFFQNYKSSMEQLLIEDLIIESIKIYGEDMLYIPRQLHNYDSVYGADDQSSYSSAIPLEIYIKNVDGFTGDGNFYSKFGTEIRDQVIFSFSQRRFAEEVTPLSLQPRPNEGDLIYFPLNNKCFQIKYVQKFEMFYQLGALQTWEVTCELFEYSNEILNTGIPEIDQLMVTESTNQFNFSLLNENGAYLVNENNAVLVLPNATLNSLIPGADNDEIQKESDQFIDFSFSNPFSEGNE